VISKVICYRVHVSLRLPLFLTTSTQLFSSRHLFLLLLMQPGGLLQYLIDRSEVINVEEIESRPQKRVYRVVCSQVGRLLLDVAGDLGEDADVVDPIVRGL